MGLGIIGMGSMGTNMVRRLMKADHQCVVYHVDSVSVHTISNQDAFGANSIESFVRHLPKPRALWMMVPEAEIDDTLNAVIPYLDREDVVIVGESSYYRDEKNRSAELKAMGVHYVDIGLSGALRGAEPGCYLMVGDLKPSVQRPERTSLASAAAIDPEAHVTGRGNTRTAHRRLGGGKSSADRRAVNRMNSGIEYGLMASYIETMKIVHLSDSAAQKQETDDDTSRDNDPVKSEQNRTERDEGKRRSKVISSWLLDMAARALVDSPGPEKFAVRVSDSEVGRWTVIAAIDESIQAPVLTGALYERLGPGIEAGFSDTVLSVLRFELEGNREDTTTGTAP